MKLVALERVVVREGRSLIATKYGPRCRIGQTGLENNQQRKTAQKITFEEIRKNVLCNANLERVTSRRTS